MYENVLICHQQPTFSKLDLWILPDKNSLHESYKGKDLITRNYIIKNKVDDKKNNLEFKMFNIL